MGISRPGAWREIKAGNLPVIVIGGRTLLDVRDLDAYLDAHKTRRGPQNDDGADDTAPTVRTPGAEIAGHEPG
jgi:hypothetical protein